MEEIIEKLENLRKRIRRHEYLYYVESNPEILHNAITRGRDIARESAQKTIKDVREIMGFRSF